MAEEATNAVTRWFGPRFSELHPLLQDLHRHGGILEGVIDIHVGTGVAGWFGKRLAAALNIPTARPRCGLRVQISHTVDALLWTRIFEGGAVMQSRFVPVGVNPTGYWREVSGPLEMRLTVDIENGGWNWRILGAAWRGIPVPLGLVPRSRAGKRISDGRYVFWVDFQLPLVGRLLGYEGVLNAVASSTEGEQLLA